jgi:cysteinyl-tRNA synthetase
VRTTNAYVNAPAASGQRRLLLVQSVARYVARSLQVLGCSWEADAGGEGESREQVLSPLLDALTAFRRAALCARACVRVAPRLTRCLPCTCARDTVRALARAKASPQELLAACDALRDGALLALGVRVDDSEGGARWKLCSPEELHKKLLKAHEAHAKLHDQARAAGAAAQ